MSTDPDQIREDIERTRAELSSDVDALTDKVSPTQMAHRQADKVRSAVGTVKDRVMGTASDAASTAGAATSSVGRSAADVAHSVSDTASELPHSAVEKTRGNPLAAGLIAFGAGWLVSSLLPSARPEQQLAVTAKEQAAGLVQEAKDVAQEVAASLKEPAQEAASAVKDRAAEAGSTLVQDGREAASDLRDSTSSATDTVRSAHADGPPQPGTSN